jgi:hypothetical protein
MGQYYKPISIDKKQHLISHDYENGLKLMEHSWIGNDFVSVVENLIKKGGDWYKNRIVWAGDYADEEPNSDKNLWGLVDSEESKINPPVEKNESLRYLVNLDTKEFVDLKKVPFDSHKMRMHPLPILTCEGNGRGGGDLNEKYDPRRITGKWARNRVIMRKTRPKAKRGFKEIIFDLVEC